MSQKQFVVLTNDDGLRADGIKALYEAVKDTFELLVVAPAEEKSGAGHSITLGKDIHLHEEHDHAFAFDGTPVDCISFALRNLVHDKPDFVISGINHGANLGNDTLCSGTVGAALAAAKEGIPSFAISMVGHAPYHFDTACIVLKKLLNKRHEMVAKIHGKVLNINVPNVPPEQLRGIKVARLGDRIWSEEFIPGKTPESFRYNHEEPINFGGTGFDVTEIQEGFATVTVLEPNLMDLHCQETLEDMAKNWQL